MPFITFIYRIEGNPRMYYGKHVTDSISDDHEGLDVDVKYELLRAINIYKTTKNAPNLNETQLTVGILSLSINKYIPTYSSEAEINCFDYYRDYHGQLFINGVKQI
jgi:hypothetical protein